MTRKLRVRRYTNRKDYEGYQILQERHWWGWKTIDREDIPSYVNIALGAYGDTGGWVSKFYALGKFDKDGYIIPH